MIVDIAYIYGADIKFPPKRKPEFRMLSATVPVQIEDLSPADAPIAFWWNDPSMDKDFRTAIRGVDGKLYAPVVSEGDLIDGTRDSEVRVFKSTRKRVARERMPRFVSNADLGVLKDCRPVSRKTDTGFAVQRVSEFPFENVEGGVLVDSTRDEAEREIVQHFSKYLLVDGILHRTIACPVFEVETEHFPSIRIARHDGLYKDDVANRFRIDRFDEARALYVSSLDRSYQSPSEFDHLRPEIVDASLIGLDERRYLVDEMVGKALKAMSRRHDSYNRYGSQAPHVAMLSREAMLAYARLRDRHDPATPSEDLLVDLSTLADALGRGGYYRDIVGSIDDLLERMRREGFVFEDADMKALEVGL